MGMANHDALAAAKKAAAARFAENPPPAVAQAPSVDLDEAECLVQLFIEMLGTGLKMGLGAMPDGLAFWVRLSVPSEATSPYAGMVSFLVSDEPLSSLRKAVAALEASPKPPFWKPDQYAKPKPEAT